MNEEKIIKDCWEKDVSPRFVEREYRIKKELVEYYYKRFNENKGKLNGK